MTCWSTHKSDLGSYLFLHRKFVIGTSFDFWGGI
jgi:hypothetical protein